MNLLRRSFAGVNSRFHLVGFYTLLDLLVRIVAAQVDDSAEWAIVFVFVSMAALGCTFGILGLVYSAAAGRPRGSPRFIECAAVLFLPLFWLQIKIALLVWVPVALGAAGWHALAAPDQPLETWAQAPIWWIAPAVDAITLLLTVYCTPVAIRQRERRVWGSPLRDGLALFRFRTSDAMRLLVLVLAIGGVGAALHYMEEPGKEAPVPGVAQGLALLLTSWLTLAALYGASLVVLQPTTAPGDAARRPDDARPDDERRDTDRPDDDRPDGDAAAPGPPA